VASGLAIIALVFLPLLTLEGLEGKLFAPVALTIVLALLSALLLALTLVPVLSFFGLKKTEGHDVAHHEPWLMRQLAPRYGRLLDWAFAHRKSVFVAAGLSLVVAVGAYSVTGTIFLPTMDEGSSIVQLTKLPSISLPHSMEIDRAAQKAIMSQVPEVANVISRTGSDELGLDPMGLNETDSFVILKPRSEWRVGDKEWLVNQIRKAVSNLPGVETSFTQPIEMRISEMLTGARGDLAIRIFGPDSAELGRWPKRFSAACAPFRAPARR
jgi:cobalt-zinc-cadmium resistance protein CzcA